VQGLTTLFDRLTLTRGVRLDDDEQFGTHTSYKFNAAGSCRMEHHAARQCRQRLQAPSLFQEFGPNSNPLGALKRRRQRAGKSAPIRRFGTTECTPR